MNVRIQSWIWIGMKQGKKRSSRTGVGDVCLVAADLIARHDDLRVLKEVIDC